MTTTRIPVQYTNSDRTPVTTIGLLRDQWRGSGPAEPTSRVLAGSDDQWAAEEWAEPGEVDVDGVWRPAVLVFLFRASEVSEQAADYPWDTAAERIILRD